MPRRVIPYQPIWRIDEGGAIVAVKRIPCVVYAPKYDSQLREEYEVEITSENTFRLYATKIAKRDVRDFVGEFRTYEEVRDTMFGKFFKDFNRPSEYAIHYGGRSPMETLWDYTEKGRQVKGSISIVEGSKTITVVEAKPRVITVKIKKAPPFILTISGLYPKYFEKSRERHERRLARLRRAKRGGGVGRIFR